MTSIIDLCMELPYRDRLNLCQALKDSIIRERKEKRQVHMNRGAVLLGYMRSILGREIPVNSRLSEFVWARTMVAYQLTTEGYSSNEIARMIHKDHATILYMRNKMQDALHYPNAYKDIIDIWMQFQNKIQDDIHKGTDQNTISLGAELPDCHPLQLGDESRSDIHPGDL